MVNQGHSSKLAFPMAALILPLAKNTKKQQLCNRLDMIDRNITLLYIIFIIIHVTIIIIHVTIIISLQNFVMNIW
jgi:hypothetical protein